MGDMEAREDVEVVIDRASGVDRHFCAPLASCAEAGGVAHIAATRQCILPEWQSAQLVSGAPHRR